MELKQAGRSPAYRTFFFNTSPSVAIPLAWFYNCHGRLQNGRETGTEHTGCM
jgi:hypothetical protein